MGFFDKLFNAAKAAVENTAAENTTEKAEEKPAEQPTQPEVTTPQTEKFRFGNPNPVPYTQEINGTNVILLIRYYGTVEVDIKDPAIVESNGGIEMVKESLINEIRSITDDLVQKCSNEEHLPVSRMVTMSLTFPEIIIRQVKETWLKNYGVELIRIGYGGFALTEESKEKYDKLRKAQLEQAIPPKPAESQTSTAPDAWQCPYCGAQNTSKFCTNCGAKRGQ